MGMNLVLKRVSAADIDRLMAAPEATFGFLYPDDDLPDPASGDIDFDGYDFDYEFDAGKLWHALHFLLTGTAAGGDLPAATLLLGGDAIPGDVGYGPAMAISPKATRAFSDYLATLSREAFLDRLDLARMSALQIYPDIWDEDLGELREEVGNYFDRLRTYCLKCAEAGLGMIRAIS
jgi:hypothetical protein